MVVPGSCYSTQVNTVCPCHANTVHRCSCHKPTVPTAVTNTSSFLTQYVYLCPNSHFSAPFPICNNLALPITCHPLPVSWHLPGCSWNILLQAILLIFSSNSCGPTHQNTLNQDAVPTLITLCNCTQHVYQHHHCNITGPYIITCTTFLAPWLVPVSFGCTWRIEDLKVAVCAGSWCNIRNYY
jgi:hypothetical protein